MWPAFLPVIAGAGLCISLLRNSLRQRLWEGALAACGLEVEARSSLWEWGLELKARDKPLRVRLEANGRLWKGTRVVVEVPRPRRFSEIRIRRESSLAARTHEIEVGDEAFDNTFFIEGPMFLVHALLDAVARRLMIEVNARGSFEIVGGELRAEIRDELVPEVLPFLLEIGRRFVGIQNTERRVAEIAREDPEAAVRLRSLLFLVREHPRKRRTVEALRTACADPSPQIRLRAAQELGSEGHEALIELAESAVDDTWSAQAVTSLGQALPFERAIALLTDALGKRRLLTAHACVEGLALGGNPAAIDLLAKVLASEQGDLAAAAARALGATRNTAAEPPLILALQQEDADILAAVANALGEVGTAEAVLPLKEVSKHISHHPEIRRAVRQAIAAIQSRLPGASPGQLSLAAAEAGQLSLAHDEAGELSLATDPAGQLSLPEGEGGEVSPTGT